MTFFSGISNFNSPVPYDAFWQIGSWDNPDQIWVCATNGWTFVRAIQLALSATPSGRTYDGSTVDGSMIQVDGRFGPITAKVLWLAAQNAGATEASLAEIRREAVARGSSENGLSYITEAAIRLLNAAMHPSADDPLNAARTTDIHLPMGDGFVPFRWGIESPAPPGWESRPPEGLAGVLCSQPYLPEAVAQGTPPPPSPSVPPPPPSPEQGGPPIPAAPPGPDDLPPGVTTRPVIQTGGVSWGVVGVVTLGVVLVSWLGISLMKAPTKNTQLKRVSRRRYAHATA